MNIDNEVKVLDAITRLLEVLAWPLLLLFALLHFKAAIRSFFESLSEFSLKGGGLEASAKKTQIQAAANLAATAATDPRENASASQAAQAAAEVVSDVLTNRTVRKASKSRILWVDDIPANNASEISLFESMGIQVSLATSTDQAMDLLKKRRFNLVISDMGRPPDERAGYTLLSKMDEQRIRIPFLIYAAGGNLPAHRLEALNRGAHGSTNRATELFSLAMKALGAD